MNVMKTKINRHVCISLDVNKFKTYHITGVRSLASPLIERMDYISGVYVNTIAVVVIAVVVIVAIEIFVLCFCSYTRCCVMEQ